MAKRDKQIQKTKKRRDKIRQSKTRPRSLDEVRDDADFANLPPNELEKNLFELLANESSTWLEQPEFSELFFDPTVAMMAFITNMTQRGVDPNSFIEERDDEKHNQLLWEVINEITPILLTPKYLPPIIDALERLERRWVKNRKKSADVTGVVLVRTMLQQYALDEQNRLALSMIGLVQALTHRSILAGFASDSRFANTTAINGSSQITQSSKLDQGD
jgi:hypothetical protein